MTDSSTTAIDPARLESEVESLATTAVTLLEIGPVIHQNGPTLFAQIEKCDAFAASSRDSLFIATSLPLANALIHFASPPPRLQHAREWARHRWPAESDPTSMLAILTLVYIIEQGVKHFRNTPDRRDTWQRIHGRIAHILQAEPREAAVA